MVHTYALIRRGEGDKSIDAKGVCGVLLHQRFEQMFVLAMLLRLGREGLTIATTGTSSSESMTV